MQEETGPGGTGIGRCGVRLLEMVTGALTLCTHNIAPSEEGYQFMSVEELQVGVQAHHLGMHSFSPYGHEPVTRMALRRIHASQGC